MNILQVESATNFSGGVNQVLLNSFELKRRGHSVHVACVKDSPIHKKLKGGNFDFVFIDEERTLHSAKIIRNFLKSNKIDIVHTHHSKGHKIGLLSLLGRKKEKLVVQRSVIFPASNIFKYLNPRVNMFVANSHAVKNVLVKYFVKPEKISVVYSAINSENLSKISKSEAKKQLCSDDKFIFGIVGNYSEYKGHDILMGAFAKINNRENALLVFIGKDTERLSNKAAKLGIERDVRILGFQDNAAELINGFDCLVIPSLKESFPNVAIEAFFYKTIVLGTDVGGIPELLDEGRGFLCEPTVESLSNAMIMVYNYPNKNGVIDRAYEFAKKNLTIEKKIDKLESVYEGLLK